ncbi:SGNH hydrolase domain-containing protein, partial [bacterium]|nr:SGNH hydrolase domain-containing protein [bacterium]
ATINKQLERLFKELPNVTLVDASLPFFLNAEKDFLPFDNSGPFYVDRGHLTQHGAELILGPVVESWLEDISKN